MFPVIAPIKEDELMLTIPMTPESYFAALSMDNKHIKRGLLNV